jgi:hypothetical protein
MIVIVMGATMMMTMLLISPNKDESEKVKIKTQMTQMTIKYMKMTNLYLP